MHHGDSDSVSVQTVHDAAKPDVSRADQTTAAQKPGQLERNVDLQLGPLVLLLFADFGNVNHHLLKRKQEPVRETHSEAETLPLQIPSPCDTGKAEQAESVSERNLLQSDSDLTLQNVRVAGVD